MSEDLFVVIVGGLHHNTLGVIRSLGEMKIPAKNLWVILVGDNIKKRNMISRSKYVNAKSVFIVPSYDDIISQLMTLAEDKVLREIICCSDGAAETVMSNAGKLSNYLLPSSKLDIHSLMDKQFQCTIAEECGFEVPVSKVIHKSEISDWNIYPCITKPGKSILGGGKADIHISCSQAELEKALINTESESVQIQQFILKKMEYQLIGCSINGGEKIFIPGYTEIIRQPDNTNTGYLKYSPISGFDYNEEAVEKFIKRIGYSGLFSLEFVRNQDDTDYFLEINLRNDGNAYCVKTAGVNLPFIWVYNELNGELPDVPTSFTLPVYFMPDFSDVRRGIKSVGFFKWIKQFYQAKSHSVFNWKDMRPFVFECFAMIKVLFAKIKKRKAN